MGDLTVTTESQRDTQGRFRVRTPDYRMGRPTDYSDALASQICDHIRNGTTIRYAALAAGISHDTLYAWKAEREDFSDRLARALADCMADMSRQVVRAAQGDPTYKGDWKAALALLRARDPAEWGDTINLNQLPSNRIMEMLEASRERQQAITEDGAPALLPGDDAL